MALHKSSGRSFKDTVNATLRAGLEREVARAAAPRPRFKVIARRLGVYAQLNHANVGELLEQIEGQDHP